MKNKTEIFKNNLRKYRVWKNITQNQLANAVQVSTALIRLIENSNKLPKYQVRTRICEYFNVSQDQMFYKED